MMIVFIQFLSIIIMMEQSLQQISDFLLSQQSIFVFRKIDYPTYLHQNLIIGYLSTSSILSKQSTQLIKALHSASQKNLQNVVLGLIYRILLKPDACEQYLQHLRTLKSQAWTLAAKFMYEIIQESFDQLKPECTNGLSVLYQLIFQYQAVSGGLTIIFVKTIDCFDGSDKNLTYISFLLETFQGILDVEKERVIQQFSSQIKTLGNVLFFKLFRLISLLYLIEDQGIEPLKDTCLRLIKLLLNQDIVDLSNYGADILRFCQQLESVKQLVQINEEIRKKMTKCSEINWQNRKTILSVILPLRVQGILSFIKQQQVDRQSIWVYLNWLWKQQTHKGETSYILLIDMVRWILLNSSDSIEQSIYILEWIVIRSQDNYTIFQMIKQSIFIDWFQQHKPFDVLRCSINFLEYIVGADMRIGQQILVYLLSHKKQEIFMKMILEILLQGNNLGLIKVNQIISNSYLSNEVRTRLNELFHGKIISQQPLEPLMFDPQDSYQQMQEQQEQQPDITDDYLIVKSKSQKSVQVYSFNVQSEYSDDMEEELITVAKTPNLENCKSLLQKVITVARGYKKENQDDLIELTIKETAKVIYVLFNNQFQNFTQKKDINNNLLLYFLTQLVTQWRKASFKLEVFKKIIKTLQQLFPITGYSFAKTFLLHFKRGPANNRQVCQWLIGKQRYPTILSRLQLFMGKQVNQLYQSAAGFLITIPK